MAEWLLVAGLSLLIMATVGLVRQAAFRGDSTLLFLIPLAGLRQVQENWQNYGVLALLRVLGTVCLLVGAGLIYVQHAGATPYHRRMTYGVIFSSDGNSSKPALQRPIGVKECTF